METWKRNLVVIWFSNFTTLMGVAGIVPFLPSVVRATGVSDESELKLLSGAVYAAAFLAAAIMGPVWGLLGDRHGRKLMVLRSLLAISIFMALQSQASNVWVLLALRFLHGAFSGFVAPALTLVSVSAPPDRQGYVSSVLQTSLVSGAFVGPLAGGLVSDAWGYPAAFLVSGALAFVAFVLVAAFAVEDRSAPAADAAEVPRPGFAASVQSLLADPAMRALVLLVFLFQFGMAATEPLMALYAHQLDAAVTNVAVGAIFAVGALTNLIAAPLWGRRSDRTGYRTTLFATLTGAGLVYAMQAFAASPAHLLPVRALLGACLAGILPSAYALVGRMTPPDRRGGSFGLTLSAFQFGNVFGPLFGSVVAAALGLRAVFFVTAAILLAAALASRVAIREAAPPAAARGPA